MAPEDTAEATILAQTASLQLRSPRPSRRILSAVLSRFETVLLGATGSVAGAYLYGLLPHLK